ncbi:hypothetical protein [Ornithinimicrobium kibberense]|uniref:hypothetical protein n=1 Tax=Ornithinimicrobium kibberense TaxID=282060 RepID=UPI00360AF1AA
MSSSTGPRAAAAVSTASQASASHGSSASTRLQSASRPLLRASASAVSLASTPWARRSC